MQPISVVAVLKLVMKALGTSSAFTCRPIAGSITIRTVVETGLLPVAAASGSVVIVVLVDGVVSPEVDPRLVQFSVGNGVAVTEVADCADCEYSAMHYYQLPQGLQHLCRQSIRLPFV